MKATITAVVLLAGLVSCQGGPDPGVTLCRYVKEFRIEGRGLDGTQMNRLVERIDEHIRETRDPDVALYARRMVDAYYYNSYVRFPNATGEAAYACNKAYPELEISLGIFPTESR